MQHGRRLFHNTLINAASKPVNMIIVVLLTPFILHHLGKSVYGIWALTGSVLAYTNLLKIGLNSAINFHIPKLAHKRDDEGINRVVATSMAFYLFSAAASSLFVCLVVWKFPDWFRIGPDLRATSRMVVALVGAGIVALLPLQVYSGVLTGYQRYDFVVGRALLFQVLRAGLIVFLFWQGFGIVTLAVVSVGSDVAAGIATAMLAYQTCPGLRIERKFVDWSLLPGLVTYSLSSLMFTFGQVIQMQSGKVITGLLYDPATVTEFSVPFMLLALVGQTVLTSTRGLKPAVTLLEAMGKEAQIRQAFLFSTKYTYMIAIPAMIVFLTQGEAILHAWIGKAYTGQGGLLLAVMAVPQMLRVAQMGGFYVLTGLGKHRFFGQMIVVQALVSVALAWVLASPVGLGLLGIALGVSIPELVVSGFLIPLHHCRKLGIRLRDEFAQCVFPALIASLPFLAYALVAPRVHPIAGKLDLLLVFGIGSLPLAAGIWFIGLKREERARFIAYLRPGPRRAARAEG